MNFANNVSTQDALGISRSKREVIDLVLEGLDATNDGEEDMRTSGLPKVTYRGNPLELLRFSQTTSDHCTQTKVSI